MTNKTEKITAHQKAIQQRDSAQAAHAQAYAAMRAASTHCMNDITDDDRVALALLKIPLEQALTAVDATTEGLPEDFEFVSFCRFSEKPERASIYHAMDSYATFHKSYKSAAFAAGICKRLLKGDTYIGGVTFKGFIITPNPADDTFFIYTV